jgi:glycosyltransferase involved in cell wall biosynthesis
MMRARILVLTSTFPRWEGDIEPRFVFDLCRFLSKMYAVHVLAPHASGARVQETLAGISITRFRYFIPRLQSLAYQGGMLTRLRQNPLRVIQVPFFLLSEILAINRLLKTHHFSVIHAHWIIPQGLAAVVANLNRKDSPPILVTSHGADIYGLRHPLFTAVKRWVLHRCDAISIVSQAMRDTLHGLLPGIRSELISMGADLTELFKPDKTLTRQLTTVLFVGRLVKKKGVRYLIDAFATVLRQHAETELWIAGYGPEESRLRRQVKQLHLENNIRFLGAVEHCKLPDLYRKSTITVIPSIVTTSGDQEGLGLVIVEALGCECAVIASDLPAIHDVIRDGVTGLLARPADSDHIAAHIDMLLSDREMRNRLGLNGRNHVLRHFDWNSIYPRYASLLTSLVSKQNFSGKQVL